MNNFKPTDSEMEILQILWEKGAASVREINDILNERRDVGYTTTLKLMQIMNDKGLVLRDTASRSHIYSAVAIENDTKNNLISDFVNLAFQGSAMNLVMQALGNTKSSKDELSELKSLISKLENKS
ncbi:MAG: BlaI/MecI/CopY family transcriptional regulator [Saprospiraceae bacterium]|jgi:predicted transcriptional regulator|nr:BlaI/MecI/CopY family transcriptional regulator [Saprospiraceae bacterium]